MLYILHLKFIYINGTCFIYTKLWNENKVKFVSMKLNHYTHYKIKYFYFYIKYILNYINLKRKFIYKLIKY